jgi:hypothetical protein
MQGRAVSATGLVQPETPRGQMRIHPAHGITESRGLVRVLRVLPKGDLQIRKETLHYGAEREHSNVPR